MMNIQEFNIETLIPIATHAGQKIMEIYNREFMVEQKDDKSPLTEADREANKIIVQTLQKLYPQIPIISEENKQIDFSERKNWEWCWLVDPLDGTKEFIKKNGEFTVNIALIHQGKPVAGVVYVPAQSKMFYAIKGKGAFLINNENEPVALQIRNLAADGILRVVGSRSHNSKEVDEYVESLSSKFPKIEFVAAGSSLKFCLLAEGKADVYPRLAPTMEWDTGAGHIVAQEAGALVLDFATNEPLKYNKENLLNPHFIVKHPEI